MIVGGVNLSSTYRADPRRAVPRRAVPRRESLSAPGGSAPGGSAPGAFASGAPGPRPKQTDDPSTDVWHDTDLEIPGPVVVELEKLFKEHWQEQQGPPMAADPEFVPPAEPVGNEVVRIIGSAPKRLTSRYYVTVLTAIRNAESSIWITSAYFVPTHQEKQDLMRAARKGVDVRLLLPSHSDSSPALQVQHSHYSDLLRAGVRIYERDDGILHSKTMVIDGVWSITGSSNFDHRSVLFNDEVDAVVLGKDTGDQLATLFQSDLQHAQPIDLESWRKRSTLTKVREQFWRPREKLL